LAILGGFYASLFVYVVNCRDFLYEFIGIQSGLSNGATFDNAKGGTRFGAKTKELEANSGTLFKGNTGKGSKGTSLEKTLNFLEQLRENVKALENDITSLNAQLNTENIADYEKLAIQDELIKKQKELNELKRINMGLSGVLITGALLGTPDLRIGRNAIGGDGGSAMDANTIIKQMMEEERAKYEAILSYTSQIEQGFMNVLQTTGLIDNEFVNIVNMIKSIISGGSDIIGGITGLIGLIAAPFTGGASIPIAAGVGGIAGQAGGMSFNGGSLPNIAMPEKSTNNMPTIIINSEVEKTKSVKFYSNTLPEYERRLAVKKL